LVNARKHGSAVPKEDFMRAFFLILLGLAASALIGIAGCVGSLPAPSGITKEDSRVVDPFAKVSVQSGLSATLGMGATQSVVVVGDENLVGLVGTSVSDGVLTVALPESFRASAADPLQIQIVSAAPLLALSTSGGARLTAQGLAGDALALDASGASTLTAAGATGRLAATLSGASHVEALGLGAHDVSVGASGASLAEVCAQASIDLHLSGASRALYSCAPSSVTTDLSGGSTAEPQ
jgi:hypothetical protein